MFAVEGRFLESAKNFPENDSGTLFVEVGANQSFIDMKKYRCTVCEYIYDPALGDPDNGIAPGTPFEELPDGWICPVCGEPKEVFEPID